MQEVKLLLKQLVLGVLKIITFPLGILYGLVIWLRNKLYDWGWSESLRFSTPIINVGNLSTGGTGKTPHTAYIIELLQQQYNIATLSRGYKRRTRGFIIANEDSTAYTIGDEPMQYKHNYPNVTVTVCEDRIMAVPQLMQRKPYTKLILLDDAFQHRSIAPALNILVTDCNKLYTKDYILPFGNLREFRKGAHRADIIIVSKCNVNITTQEKENIIKQINPLVHQQVFFTSIQYSIATNLITNYKEHIQNKDVILLCGIANPAPLINYIQSICNTVHPLTYKDHHYFDTYDVKEITDTYNNLQSNNKIIITTEKDSMRLLLHRDLIMANKLPIVVLPIKIEFLFNEAEKFNTYINNFMEKYYPKIEEIIIENEYNTDTNGQEE